MARIKPRTVCYRRKRQQRTKYEKRLKLLFSRLPRLIVRFTNTKIIAQAVEFSPKGDKVVVAVDSFALKKMGWNYSCKNHPAAYLTGLMISKEAQGKGIKKAVLDTGFLSPLPKSRTYSFLKGVLENGIEVPHDPKVFPDESRLTGKHISDYAEKLKGEKGLYQQRFAEYLKSKAEPKDLPSQVEEMRKRITGK